MHDQPSWVPAARTALGCRIASARTAARLSQERLAHIAGIDRSTIQRIERGQNDARYSHLLRIARALDVPLRDLV
ncbi:helix-turn-helix domain-containing protein [Streptomyces uncialis]|uniref:helix-turn-helix domain-containing protein n=1 Tax=Streptomyces uncialis TaxID=1048205 RepID=UPI003830A7E5